MPGKIRERITAELIARLDLARAVVWYDAGGRLAPVFDALGQPGVTKIDARPSALGSRRLADSAWPDVTAGRARVLIYAPWARGETEEAQVLEPFEAWARIGASFGDRPDESLASIARQALPARATAIDRLFEETPNLSLEALEALEQQGQFPVVRAAFGRDDPIEVAAQLIAGPDLSAECCARPGLGAELVLLLASAFEYAGLVGLPEVRPRLASWVLFSEFAFDAGDALPPSVARIPRAGPRAKTAIPELGARLRKSQDFRDTYVGHANRVEKELGLTALGEEARSWGRSDTFGAQDAASLRWVAQRAVAGDIASARAEIDARRASIWRQEPERRQQWEVAARAITLLELRPSPSGQPGMRIAEQIAAYAREADGGWRIDQAQRRLEQAASGTGDRAPIEALLTRARDSYRTAIESAQQAFLSAAEVEGWPPEGLRQTQIFARYVAPALEAGEQVAYFWLDALRFEMGRDLAGALSVLGQVQIEPAATVLPTTTLFGMAALLPGADTAFGAIRHGDEIVPTIGGRRVLNVDDRMSTLIAIYGDRVTDVRLADLVDWAQARLAERTRRASLLIVRSDDLDNAGEHTRGPSARRLMTLLLDDVVTAARRLADLGYRRLVLTGDHGHILLDELPPGSVVRAPEGDWVLKKRRVRLGTALGTASGVKVLRSVRLGLGEAAPDAAFAVGLRVFEDGAAYFHEGLSLQEAVVPAIVVNVEQRPQPARPVLELGTRHPYFAARPVMVTLELLAADLFSQQRLEIRVMAVDAATQRTVGRVTVGDAFDPGTGLVTIARGQPEKVVVQIDEDFAGPMVFIRALDARFDVVLREIKLENRCAF